MQESEFTISPPARANSDQDFLQFMGSLASASCGEVGLVEEPDVARGVAHHQRVGSDILGDYSARTHHCIGSHRDLKHG